MSDTNNSDLETDDSNWDSDARIRELFKCHWMEKCHRLWEETKNPLYAWDGMLFCFSYGIPLPDWCLEYLKISALEIKKLIMGASTWASSGKSMQIFQQTLTPSKAAEKVPQALGIVRKTVNAFERMREDSELLQDYYAVGFMDPTPEQALEKEAAIMRHRNLDNIKSARARVRKGRRLFSGN